MSELTVTALIAAYNEADVISQVIGDLAGQGVQVYLLDDGSTDDTVAAASRWIGHGLIGSERLEPVRAAPGRELTLYSWRRILRRKQELALELPGDWFIHHDADELRESPFANLGLRDAIALVDRLGWNAVDFAVFSFWPTHEDFQPGDDLRQVFPCFEPGFPCDRLQIRCWKRTGHTVDLVSSGGHEAVFPGRKVFPIRFILRHYPFRGTAHGRRKLLEERLPRYDPEEQTLGWHLQYDQPEQLRFVRDPETLTRFDPDEVRARLAVDSRLVEELRGDPEARRLAEEGAARELAVLGHELDAVNREVARLANELDAANHEVLRLSCELDRRNREVMKLRTELAPLAQAAAAGEEARQRLVEILGSRSWRLTAPLRRLLTALGIR